MFDRLISLIGSDNLSLIQTKKVLLIGLGGVGSYALESLVRNGFKKITVVDFDKIDITNLNRQLITDSILRAKKINPDSLIDGIENKLTIDNINVLLDLDFDYIIDACDDVSIKFKLIENSLHYNYKLISSMGTANKLDPSKLEITTLDKTINDPLARILRKKVKEAKINKKIYVVSSREVPIKNDTLGTANLVPSITGILCVSYIINDILK